jgi:spore maturation protein CgeB
MRSMLAMGHDVRLFEPCTAWSIEHLREEALGEAALRCFSDAYPELRITTYTGAQSCDLSFWRSSLRDCDVVILHEWNPPELAQILLELRDQLGFCLLFHDTHHRASSSPEQIRRFDIARFNGVITFGEALLNIYRSRFNIHNAWILHEAADTTVFRPHPHAMKTDDVIWVGNWGDNERADEIRTYLLKPAAQLSQHTIAIYGVRYPENALRELRDAGVHYRGYLPNLEAPAAYARARLTVHIPRRQYSSAMTGIPTIRVFEALACGIPLICSPWVDTEHLFREGDFLMVRDTDQMKSTMEYLLGDNGASEAHALRGLETILSRHTCAHRAEELTSICEELLK